MPIGSDTFATRRNLPHLQRPGKCYFLTFITSSRKVLPAEARSIALECCIHDHTSTYGLYAAVVMPDHAHLILTPYDAWTLPRVLRRIKGVSARMINKQSGDAGALWQSETFDRVLRSSEEIREKAEYICENPVRAGLSPDVESYPWKWRLWIEGAA